VIKFDGAITFIQEIISILHQNNYSCRYSWWINHRKWFQECS